MKSFIWFVGIAAARHCGADGDMAVVRPSLWKCPSAGRWFRLRVDCQCIRCDFQTSKINPNKSQQSQFSHNQSFISRSSNSPIAISMHGMCRRFSCDTNIVWEEIQIAIGMACLAGAAAVVSIVIFFFIFCSHYPFIEIGRDKRVSSAGAALW